MKAFLSLEFLDVGKCAGVRDWAPEAYVNLTFICSSFKVRKINLAELVYKGA